MLCTRSARSKVPPSSSSSSSSSTMGSCKKDVPPPEQGHRADEAHAVQGPLYACWLCPKKDSTNHTCPHLILKLSMTSCLEGVRCTPEQHVPYAGSNRVLGLGSFESLIVRSVRGCSDESGRWALRSTPHDRSAAPTTPMGDLYSHLTLVDDPHAQRSSCRVCGS
jgi:hypothetical protein